MAVARKKTLSITEVTAAAILPVGEAGRIAAAMKTADRAIEATAAKTRLVRNMM
jgi:hypothetical protein